MTSWSRRKLRAFHCDRKGAALLYVTVCLPVIFAMAVFSLDLGYMLFIKSRLQTAADLGALAGVKLLYTNTNPVDAGNQAVEVTKKNLPLQWTSSNALVTTTVDVTYKCASTAPFSSTDCAYAASGKNALMVTATATVPMFFASFFGTKTKTFKVNSVAGGGNTPPMNVVVIIDSTASMSAQCSSDTTKTKLECAKKGVRDMLGTLWPSTATVSLMTYPGLNASNANALKYVTCNPNGILTGPTVQNGNPVIPNVGGVQWYDSNPLYTIVKESIKYRLNPTSVPPGGLDTSDPLVIAAGGGAGTCANTFKPTFKNGSITSSTGTQTGLQSPGGASTYFAPVLKAAQDLLVSANAGLTVKRQNVIIILSDGDASATKKLPPLVNSSTPTGQLCQDAINVASDAAKAASPNGAWVYSIAYDAPNSGCSNDPNTGCSTMKAMASDPSKFYSNSSTCDAGAGNTNADLSVIFKNIAVSLMKTRRVSESLF